MKIATPYSPNFGCSASSSCHFVGDENSTMTIDQNRYVGTKAANDERVDATIVGAESMRILTPMRDVVFREI